MTTYNHNKLSQQEAEERFSKMGFTLSETYIGSSTKLNASCNTCTYSWNTRPSAVFAGYKCPVCGGQKENAHRLAEFKEGVKLTKATLQDLTDRLSERNIMPKQGQIYQGSTIPMTFVCKDTNCNHEFVNRPSHLLHAGTGCPKCTGNKPLWKQSTRVAKTRSQEVVDAIEKRRKAREQREIDKITAKANRSNPELIKITQDFVNDTERRKYVTKIVTGVPMFDKAFKYTCTHPNCNYTWSVPTVLTDTSQQRPTCPKCSELINKHLNPQQPQKTVRQLTSNQSNAITNPHQLFMYTTRTLYSQLENPNSWEYLDPTTDAPEYLIVAVGEWSNKPLLTLENNLQRHSIPTVLKSHYKLTKADASTLFALLYTRTTNQHIANNLKLDKPVRKNTKASQQLQLESFILPYTSYNQVKNIIESYLQEEF